MINDSAWSDLLRFISSLRAGGNRELKSPLKPLMVLASLGRIQNFSESLHRFAEVEDTMALAIRLFGKPGALPQPWEPFVRLSHDSIDGRQIWVLEPKKLESRVSNKSSVKISEIREHDARAGFAPAYFSALLTDKMLFRVFTLSILHEFFPVSIHSEILSLMGLSLGEESCSLSSYADFTQAMRAAYQERCAILGCGYKLHGAVVGAEPCLIRWTQHGGKLEAANALFLSPLVRRLFDLGAIAICPKTRTILLSKDFREESAHDMEMRGLAGVQIREPISADLRPSDENLHWHFKNVFRG